VLAAFAGFTLAAGLSALYLWQERRLKRRESSILRLRAPALAKLDDVAARTIAVALPALTLGVAVGVVRLEDSGGGLDALMAVTVLTWGVYAAYLALRRLAGWRGRRAAYLVLAGFVLVVVVRLALPVTHFGT
jgi:ABC-type transport system involved in cytochrome c biogenesis permease subunit